MLTLAGTPWHYEGLSSHVKEGVGLGWISLSFLLLLLLLNLDKPSPTPTPIEANVTMTAATMIILVPMLVPVDTVVDAAISMVGIYLTS